MEWTETGFIIGTRRHGETSLIIEAFTGGHGRHLGLVKGGRGTRWRGVLQPGNRLRFTWRARLSEHLGHYALEPEALRAAEVMADPLALAALNSLNAMVRLLPERDPHPQLFLLFEAIVEALPAGAGWPAALARFELVLLAELGFGLDLDSCAATGANDDLAYVSPKSGRAVSLSAGEPYKDKLFSLPRFLRDETLAPDDVDDLVAAFRLTRYFLARDVYAPRGLTPPESGERMIRLLRQAAAARH
ncbi:MAG TPA: DNA repair protein RecO [Hyphomicrobiales bacterium]|nr:DNA repair protein RecO [Hyphomicrobiales bacterium]